ncbi:hypothetical protein FRC03_008490 [Tulasnella sp. 419]|nr:hypothetical protein FRC03_008490 [Tulasnella sp. 419]
MSGKRATPVCQICGIVPFKYTCPKCQLIYCSVICYKTHKEKTCTVPSASESKLSPESSLDEKDGRNTSESREPSLPEPKPLRPLTSLKWPYIPEAPSYPDPLERDQPKPLRLYQYETIASSPKIRSILNNSAKVRNALQHIDTLEGDSREQMLERILGVADTGQHGLTTISSVIQEEDFKALQQLAEAVEEAVKGGQPGTEIDAGLTWADKPDSAFQ